MALSCQINFKHKNDISGVLIKYRITFKIISAIYSNLDECYLLAGYFLDWLYVYFKYGECWL